MSRGRLAALRVARKTAWRNRKRTLLIVILVAVPVAVAVFAAGVTRASFVSAEDRATAEFGPADVKIVTEPRVGDRVSETINGIDPAATFTRHRQAFGLLAPSEGGMVTDVDPALGTLALVEGRLPAGDDEVAISDYLAYRMGIDVGDEAELLLGTTEPVGYRVVGLVRQRLSWVGATVLVSSRVMDALGEISTMTAEEVWLVSTEHPGFDEAFTPAWEQTLVDFLPAPPVSPRPPELEHMSIGTYGFLDEGQVAEIVALIQQDDWDQAWARADRIAAEAQSESGPLPYLELAVRQWYFFDPSIGERAPAVGTGVAALLMAEVAFIAGAAFATGTRRRLREIGLMGANGASESQVRLTVVGEGLSAGLVGGLTGAGLGVLGLVVARPLLQRLVSRVVEGIPASVVDVIGPVLVAVAACVIAAWLPARTAATVPTATALQGRMPVSPPRRWVVPVGVVAGAFGTLLFAVGAASESTGGGALAVIGVALMIGGVALLTGPLVAGVSRAADRLPTTWRLVLRDSGRQRGRAAAAVSAMMVILIAPVAGLTQLESSSARHLLDGLPEPANQVLIYGRYEAPVFINIALRPSDIDSVRAGFPESHIVEFEALDTSVAYPGEVAARRDPSSPEVNAFYGDEGWRVAVANPELLSLLDDQRLERALSQEGMALIGIEERRTEIDIAGQERAVAEIPIPVVRRAMPRVVVTEDTAAAIAGERQLQAILVSPRPLTSDQWSLLHAAGLTFTGSGFGLPWGWILTAVLAATLVVVLIVIATVTALSAAEADNDLVTVVAVGAPNSIRRRFLGIQTGAYTLLAALLAVPLGLLLMKTGIKTNEYVYMHVFGVSVTSRLIVPWLGIGFLVVALPVIVASITAVAVRSAPLTPPRRAT